MATWRERISRWMRSMSTGWRALRRIAAVLLIIRFSVLIPLMLAATLIAADQMVDILRALGEDRRHLAILWLVITTTFAALVVWYAARTMFLFHFQAHPASEATVHPQLKRWAPRVCGVSIPAMLTVRVALLAHSSTQAMGLWIFAAVLGALTLLLGLYVSQQQFVTQSTPAGGASAATRTPMRNLARMRQLPPITGRILIGLLLVNVVTLCVFTSAAFYRLDVPATMGAPAILLLGLGLTTVIGSALVYLGNHNGIPIITALILWAVLCSVNNDNHVVRLTSALDSHKVFMDAPSPAAAQSGIDQAPTNKDIAGYFEEWWTELAQNEPGSEPIPVFVVAAEGGGLRAAYWTAQVLATLEEASLSNPQAFSRHVFAISGVSGGSVGAALYDAVLAQRLNAAPDADSRVAEIDAVLRRDFLAGTLGAGLFPDLLQRFIPLPVFNDRALALERDFEYAWQRAHHDNARFAAPFLALWERTPHAIPLLFLNSTVVETGERAINAPVLLSSPRAASAFGDALSLRPVTGPSMPLSTAALLSARFTYVSPAGLIDRTPGSTPTWIRIVDGGYFDNSGAVTAQEIVREINRSFAALSVKTSVPRGMNLIVLHLPNEPNSARGLQTGREWLSETLSPVKALLHTRTARGSQATAYLGEEPGTTLLSLRPARGALTAPLGWVLSEEVRSEMRAQLRSTGNDCVARQLAWIEGMLTRSAGKPLATPLEAVQDLCKP